jgi:predicted RNA methylase
VVTADRSGKDWLAWHEQYDDHEGSNLAARLGRVQASISAVLDAAPAGPIRVLSMCAGQGRDLLGVLAEHPRAPEVQAVLVELDPRNAAIARAAAAALEAADVEVIEADAGTTGVYRAAAPAHLLLVCGVFGNISESDIADTIAALPSLAAPHAHLIWTRHRRAPDLTPWVRQQVEQAGFSEVAFETGGDPRSGTDFGVGRARLDRAPDPFVADRRLFSFG